MLWTTGESKFGVVRGFFVENPWTVDFLDSSTEITGGRASNRRTLYEEMSDESSETLRGHLLSMTDDELLALVENSSDQTSGVGACCTAVMGDKKVFVKRLPLTDIEYAQPYSTCNHFNLPTFYSYGVGSAGFGPWRELAALDELTGPVASLCC